MENPNALTIVQGAMVTSKNQKSQTAKPIAFKDYAAERGHSDVKALTKEVRKELHTSYDTYKTEFYHAARSVSAALIADDNVSIVAIRRNVNGGGTITFKPAKASMTLKEQMEVLRAENAALKAKMNAQ